MANGTDPDGLVQEKGPEGKEFLRLVEERERLLGEIGEGVLSDVVLAQIRQLRPDQAVAFLRKNIDSPQELRFAQPPRSMQFRGDNMRTVAEKARDLQQLLNVQAETGQGAAQDATRVGARSEGEQGLLGTVIQFIEERNREMQEAQAEGGVVGGPGILELLMPTPGGAVAGAARGRSALGAVDEMLPAQREMVLKSLGHEAKRSAQPGSYMSEIPLERAGRLREILFEAANAKAKAGPVRRRLEGARDVAERVTGGTIGIGGPQRSSSRNLELLLDNVLSVPLEALRTEAVTEAREQAMEEFMGLAEFLSQFVDQGEEAEE